MKKELRLDRNRKMLAGVIAGVQRTYLPNVDLAVLRALVVLAAVFIHPLTPVILGMYAVLWFLLPKKTAGQITY